MTERDYAPLSGACVRGLCDKLYEKRKVAGAEIEKMVKEFQDANNANQIRKLIKVLAQDLMPNQNPNVKNGALMGLSSVSVGLGKGEMTLAESMVFTGSKAKISTYQVDSVTYLPDLIKPILACFSDPDARVRYQAVEAMFNVVKIVRSSILGHFPVLFDALSKLAMDPEMQVKQGAELLDRLIKDIVTENATFDLAAFIPVLRERIYTRNAYGRQFMISWVSVLDAVPDLDLILYLPELLEPLLKMLDDHMSEIRRMVDVQLNEFLRSIKKDPSRVDFKSMINILITHAQSNEEMLQFTSIIWLKEFVELSGDEMVPYLSGILTAILPCLSYNDDSKRNIKETAATVNLQLNKLISDVYHQEQVGLIDLPSVVEALANLLKINSVRTKVAVLKWILHLYYTMPNEMFCHTEMIFFNLLESLSDNSDDVVRQALAVLAEICTCQKDVSLEESVYYYTFLKTLMRHLAADEALLEDRGAFIVRQLCVLLNPEHIYRALSNILKEEKNLKFASIFVDVLNTILLTSAELFELRTQLRDFNKESVRNLFECYMYECWCHSPVSLVSLCLLTHNYAHSRELITLFGDLEITVDFLTEIDKLVQLIESPIFAYMRLELLGGHESNELRAALYGLIMLLPQTEAFHTLRKRLQSAPAHLITQTKHSKAASPVTSINFDKLLNTFLNVQAAHRNYKLKARAKNLATAESNTS